jgi:hypothetical protein
MTTVNFYNDHSHPLGTDRYLLLPAKSLKTFL